MLSVCVLQSRCVVCCMVWKLTQNWGCGRHRLDRRQSCSPGALGLCTTKWCFFTLVSLKDGIQLPAHGFWSVFIVEGADGPLGAPLPSLLAAWPMDSRYSPSLLPQYWDTKCVCCHAWLSCGFWGSNSGPHAGKWSPLPTDPSHWPSLWFFSGSHLPPVWLLFPTHLPVPTCCSSVLSSN